MPSAHITSYKPTLSGDLATIIDRDWVSLFSAEGTRSTGEVPFPRKEMECLFFPFSVLPNAALLPKWAFIPVQIKLPRGNPYGVGWILMLAYAEYPVGPCARTRYLKVRCMGHIESM
jgi:hypothetical protein